MSSILGGELNRGMVNTRENETKEQSERKRECDRATEPGVEITSTGYVYRTQDVVWWYGSRSFPERNHLRNSLMRNWLVRNWLEGWFSGS